MLTNERWIKSMDTETLARFLMNASDFTDIACSICKKKNVPNCDGSMCLSAIADLLRTERNGEYN